MDRLSMDGPVYKYLETYGLTLLAFSQASGVFYTTLSKVLNGERKIPARLKDYWREQGVSEITIREWCRQHETLMGERANLKTRRVAA